MLLTVALAIGMLVVAGATRWRTGSWSHPATVFALFWSLMTLLPFLAVREASGSPTATSYLFAAVAAFSLPTLLMKWQPAVETARGRQLDPAPYRGTSILLAAIGVQLLCIVLMLTNIGQQGLDFGRLASNPLEVACVYLEGRYEGTMLPTAFGQVATVLNYIGVALAGISLASRKGALVRLATLALAFVPSLIAVLLMADKGTIFLALAFFYGGVIVARVANGNLSLLTWTTGATAILAVAVIVPVMLLALLNRGDGSCTDTQRTSEIFSSLAQSITPPPGLGVPSAGQAPASPGALDNATLPDNAVGTRNDKLRFAVSSYAFGHYFAFGDWFDHYVLGYRATQHYIDPPRQTWGFWTFMAVGKLVDRSYVLPAGYFNEYYTVDGVLKTNIYTMFRGMIYDFGVVGSLLFMATFGWVSALVYRPMLVRAVSPVSQAAYVLIWGVIYTSYIISLLIWNSVYLAPVGLALILLASRYRTAGVQAKIDPLTKPAVDSHL